MIAVIRTLGAAALAGLLLTLAACGDGEPPASEADKKTRLDAAAPGDLTAYVQARLRARHAQGSAGSGDFVGGPVTAMPVTGAAPPERSGTVLQEAGVDETDLLKSDGTRLYTLQPEGLSGGRLQAYRRADDGSLARLASLALPTDPVSALTLDGMVLGDDGRTLAVVSQAWSEVQTADLCGSACGAALLPPSWMLSSVLVQRVDVADPAAPAAGTRIGIQGHLVGTRRIGHLLYLVTSHAPPLPTEWLPSTTSNAQREAAIAAVRAADLLPRQRVNGGAPQPLVAETDCWVQTGNGSLAIEFTTVTVLDLSTPTLERRSRCFAGGAEAVYLTPAALYVASTRFAYMPVAGMLRYPERISTDLHKFALAGGSVEYRASGSVDGHLGWNFEKKPLRLSEHAGDLRVLSFTGREGWAFLADAASSSAPPPSPALLTVLRESAAGGTLEALATLPSTRRPAPIGKPDEQVYAVRFDGARAYVVTFRRIDPLYVLDLADPADPKVAGELQVPGVSDDLHPLPGGLLFGAGRDADDSGRITGLRFALFDVQDAAAPRQLATYTLGGPSSQMALDGTRHGIDLFVDGGKARIALPVNLADADGNVWTDGLARFEVDLAARTMAPRSLLGERSGEWRDHYALSRSLQIGPQVYALQSGTLNGYAWAP